MKTADLIDTYIREGAFPISTFEIKLDDSSQYLGKLCKRGHDYAGTGKSVRSKKHRNCMICMRLNAFVWLDKNRERARETGRKYEATDRGRRLKREAQQKFYAREDAIFYSLTQGAKSRAKKKGLPCDITLQYIISLLKEQKGKCYWTGVDFIFHGSARHPFKPSIDRLIPALGYTMGNVVLASNFANRARGDMPPEEFRCALEEVKQSLHKLSPVSCDKNS